MWTNPQETAQLLRFTEEIFNGKLHFLSIVGVSLWWSFLSKIAHGTHPAGNVQSGHMLKVFSTHAETLNTCWNFEHMFKVNNRNTSSKVTIKTPGIVLLSSLLTLNKLHTFL